MLSNFPKVRLGLYFVALISQVAAIFAPVWFPELAGPFKQTSDYLGVIALGTAVSNTPLAIPAPVASDGRHEA